MRTQELLNRLAERLEIDDLEPDSAGAYEINFDSAYRVVVTPMGESQLRLQARAGKLPEDAIERENHLRHFMLRATARLSDVWGGDEVLTIDTERDELLIFHVLDLDALDTETLCERIEKFVNAVAYWSESDAPQRAVGQHPLLARW